MFSCRSAEAPEADDRGQNPGRFNQAEAADQAGANPHRYEARVSDTCLRTRACSMYTLPYVYTYV